MATDVGELGKVVVITYEDGKGTGPRLMRALDVPSGSWKRLVYPLQRGQAIASMSEVGALGQVVNFVNDSGIIQISVISVEQLIPTSACANIVHAIFNLVLSKAPVQDSSFTLIIPTVTPLPGSVHDLLAPNKSLLAAFINGTSEIEYGVLGNCPRIPGTTRIQEEFLAVLVHFVHIMALPTVLLLGPKTQRLQSSGNEPQEVINQLGSTVAKQLGLVFSKDAATNGIDDSWAGSNLSYLDDWRSLYT